MRRSTFILGLAAAPLGLAHLSVRAATKLVVSFTPTAEFGAAFVAKERGFFAKHGLDVTLQALPVAPNVPAALTSESVQIGGTTPSVVLQAIDAGLDLVAVAGGGTFELKGAPAPIGVVVRKDLNYQAPSDLVGKKVAVPGIGAAIHVLTRDWLMKSGVDVKQVNFVEVAIPQMPDVIKGGSVDAAAVPEPFLSRIVQSGAGVAVPAFAASLPDGISTVLYASTRKWATENADTVKAFRAALEEGAAVVASQRDVALQDIGKYIRVPEPILKAMPYPHVEPRLKAAQLEYWDAVLRKQAMVRKAVPLDTVILP